METGRSRSFVIGMIMIVLSWNCRSQEITAVRLIEKATCSEYGCVDSFLISSGFPRAEVMRTELNITGFYEPEEAAVANGSIMVVQNANGRSISYTIYTETVFIKLLEEFNSLGFEEVDSQSEQDLRIYESRKHKKIILRSNMVNQPGVRIYVLVVDYKK